MLGPQASRLPESKITKLLHERPCVSDQGCAGTRAGEDACGPSTTIGENKEAPLWYSVRLQHAARYQSGARPPHSKSWWLYGIPA